MATHGTILVKQERSKVLLNTRHDGHTDEALQMLLELPGRIASHSYLPQLYADRTGNITPERIQKDLRQLAGAGFEWTLLEIAHAITAQHFNRWLIIPPNYVRHLADYDQTPDLTLDTSNLSLVTVHGADEVNTEEWNGIIEKFNADIPVHLSVTRRENMVEVPYYSLYVEALCKAARYQQKVHQDGDKG